MVARKRGLPEDAALGGQSKRSGGLVTALKQARSGVVEVDVGRIAANPENPAPRMTTKIEELASSIQAQGLIHPLTVCSLAAYVADHPEYAGSLTDADYVTLDGDRRRVAAIHAGGGLVPVLVRDDLASDPDGVRLATALQRLELTPIQEAISYQRKADKGLSHAAIAAAAGVSQGQVTKRLKLLRLPDSVQVAIEVGLYPVIEGLNLLKEDDAVVERTGELVAQAVDRGDLVVVAGEGESAEGPRATARWDLQLPALAKAAKSEIRKRESARQAKEVAATLGVPYVGSPEVEFQRPYAHAVYDEAALPALAAAGDLVVAPSPSGVGVGYYRRSTERSVQNPDEQRARERAKTRKQRRPFLEELLDVKPSAARLREAMVMLAFDTIVDAQPRKLAAARWAERHPAQRIEYYNLASLSSAPDRVMVAWWVYLYALDARLGGYVALGEPEFDYLQDLIKVVGYEPSPTELEAIAQFRKTLEKENDR